LDKQALAEALLICFRRSLTVCPDFATKTMVDHSGVDLQNAPESDPFRARLDLLRSSGPIALRRDIRAQVFTWNDLCCCFLPVRPGTG